MIRIQSEDAHHVNKANKSKFSFRKSIIGGNYELQRRFKKQLKDYYGTAMCSGNPMAVIELSKVENASDYELERLARQAGIDTNNNNRNPFGW